MAAAVGVGAEVPSSLPHLLYTGPAVVLKDGGGLVDCLTLGLIYRHN